MRAFFFALGLAITLVGCPRTPPPVSSPERAPLESARPHGPTPPGSAGPPPPLDPVPPTETTTGTP